MTTNTLAPRDALPADFVVRQVERKSCSRRMWIILSYVCTWWVPSFVLRCFGMRRADVRQAWREKVTICFMVLLASAATLFVIIGLSMILCPKQHTLSRFEVELYNKPEKPYVSAYGRYYDISEIYESHVNGAIGVEKFEMQSILGQDVSQMFFPARNWDKSCPGIPDPGPTWDNLIERTPRRFWPHYVVDEKTGLTSNYLGMLEKYAKGRIAWLPEYLSKLSKEDPTKKIVIFYDNVYDVSTYFTANEPFFDENMGQIFTTFAGKDATSVMEKLLTQNPKYYRAVVNCMNKIFYIGTIDHRLDLRCVLSNWILVSLSAVMALVFLVKFIFAIVGARTRNNPEEIKRGVIIQVPCYTEGKQELLGTFNSIATSEYDNELKMMIVVCDGVITGSGNDKPTPQIALDILYGDDQVPEEPERLVYEAVAEGKRGVNRAQVYGGIYTYKGNKLPFIVIVKCGTKDERSKPGNRGKRDSQVLLQRFLNRSYAGAPMSSLELELYRQFIRVVGKQPREYEYFLMVDADTHLQEHALNRLVLTMVMDKSIIGACGVTEVTNDEGWITALQKYEYFISHYLGKAFESSFGSVTCLPGCFSIYRIRDQDPKSPKLFFIAPVIIDEYSVTKVDTLHLRNLYHLGEDRFLTTLMLKHFPDFSTVMVPDAFCYTKVPNRWDVLLSQRRRWINSTIHNLWELMGLSQLAGCLCFGLRFVIFLEFIAALVGPATILYLYYLLYTVVFGGEMLPLVSLIMLGAMYGLQAIIILGKWKLEYIGIMVLFILLGTFPFPSMALALPLYAFWKMDDFSWGQTRIILGQNGELEEASDDGYYDPSSIPKKKWSEHEKELLEAENAAKAAEKAARRERRRARHAGSLSHGSQASSGPSDDIAVAENTGTPPRVYSPYYPNGSESPHRLGQLPYAGHSPYAGHPHMPVMPVMPSDAIRNLNGTTYSQSVIGAPSRPAPSVFAPPGSLHTYAASDIGISRGMPAPPSVIALPSPMMPAPQPAMRPPTVPYFTTPAPPSLPFNHYAMPAGSQTPMAPFDDGIDTRSSVSNVSYRERKRRQAAGESRRQRGDREPKAKSKSKRSRDAE